MDFFYKVLQVLTAGDNSLILFTISIGLFSASFISNWTEKILLDFRVKSVVKKMYSNVQMYSGHEEIIKELTRNINLYNRDKRKQVPHFVFLRALKQKVVLEKGKKGNRELLLCINKLIDNENDNNRFGDVSDNIQKRFVELSRQFKSRLNSNVVEDLMPLYEAVKDLNQRYDSQRRWTNTSTLIGGVGVVFSLVGFLIQSGVWPFN